MVTSASHVPSLTSDSRWLVPRMVDSGLFADDLAQDPARLFLGWRGDVDALEEVGVGRVILDLSLGGRT